MPIGKTALFFVIYRHMRKLWPQNSRCTGKRWRVNFLIRAGSVFIFGKEICIPVPLYLGKISFQSHKSRGWE